MTQDITWESDKNTIEHHKREPRGQPFPSSRPQGSNEQTRKHDKHKTNNTNDPQKKYCLGTVSKNILLEGLKNSMIRKYHKLQTNPWHREEEPHNNHETPKLEGT